MPGGVADGEGAGAADGAELGEATRLRNGLGVGVGVGRVETSGWRAAASSGVGPVPGRAVVRSARGITSPSAAGQLMAAAAAPTIRLTAKNTIMRLVV